jgi:hypothetical protein
VVEIDATKARQFCWNGNIRITERTVPARPFTPRSEWIEISRIELVGEDGRNVVIRPIEELRGDKPYACVQDVGAPPDQYLVPLRKQLRVFQRAWECMRTWEDTPECPPQDEASREVLGEAISEYSRVSSHIHKREFEKVSGAQVAFAGAFLATQLESIYKLDERTMVRVRIENDSLLTVTVEDKDGNVMHRYCPEELVAAEVDDH